ncbi:Death-associated protein kinase 1 [Hypsibius exemplaris]|uniref:Death-associated protein kinase 1 n=1 Tax=Hypsibius exemplaris TaxID=2072580 RepID=A0A1W0WTX6_HYPEX|nr:Death-associated protein kinase 1 [Hypsibius exemplaris]
MRNVEYQKTPFEERYEVTRELGSGHFAVVRQCVEKSTGQAFAAKFIRKRRQKFSRRGAPIEDIDNEISLLLCLKHEHIITLHEVFEDDNHVILVLELVSGGELFHYLSERDHLSEEDATKFVQQILYALDHLHQHNVAHLDLKPENILLSSADSQVIKIIDFGLAKRLDQFGKEVKCMMGTAEFIAPEVVNFEALSLQTDMWSVGVITYMLLSGSSPFAGQDQQDRQEVFSTTSDLAKDFISRLLVRDPKKRFTPRQAIEHPWIRPRNPQQAVKRKASAINMTRLKAFSAKRRWQKSLRVIKLCNRLSKGNRPASTASMVSTDASSNEGLDMPPENFVTRAIFCAVEDGNRQGLERLLSMATVDLSVANELGVTAAHVAAGAGRLLILQLLRDTYRLNLSLADHYGDTPLHWAARQGQKETLEYILTIPGLDAGVLNVNQETALCQAVRYGHRSLFTPLLRSCDASLINALNADGDGVLHLAAWYGSIECLRELLAEPKIMINLQNGQQETALHICSSKGALACVEQLVASGADVNVTDGAGTTALVLALRNNQAEVGNFLLTKTRLTLIDGEGCSLLHRACETGSESVVEYLLAKQPELLNRLSSSGSTPLHQAARFGHLEIARQLCAAGADVEALDADGLSAEVGAFLTGHKAIGEFLKCLGDRTTRTKLLSDIRTKQGQLNCFTVRVLGHPRVGKTSFIKSLQNSTAGNFVRRGSAFFRRGKSGKKSPPSKSTSMTNMQQMCHGYPLFSTTCVSLSPELDVAVFEMSADPLCLQLYDHAIRSTSCLYIVLYSLQESAATQRQQVSFWLRLLSLSFHPADPIGYAGKPSNAPMVLLIGTHADTVKCSKLQNGLLTNPMAHTLVENMKRHFGSELTVLSDTFVLDNNAKSPGANLSGVKSSMLSVGRLLRSHQTLSSGVFKKIQHRLPLWRASRLYFSFGKFTELLQGEVNPLITAKDAAVLVQQLVFTGEVFDIPGGIDGAAGAAESNVVISPHHLFNQLVMPFLYGQLQLKSPRAVFRPRDLHFIFSNYWHDTVEVTETLRFLGVCAEIGADFEFPALAERSTLSTTPPASSLSIRIQIPDFPSYPVLIFPRILAHVRSHTQSIRHLQAMQVSYRGLAVRDFGTVVRWSNGEAIEITGGGDRDIATAATVLKDICSAVDSAIHTMLPSALLEYTVLINGQQVPFLQADELQMRNLPLPLVCRLCRMLDPKNCFGQDWCLLAVKLKLYDRLLPKLAINSASPVESTTHLLLKEWIAAAPKATAQQLLLGLEEIERADVAGIVRKFLPVYEHVLGGALDLSSPASPSEKTLSSISSSLLSR